jgi:hypothetical protein
MSSGGVLCVVIRRSGLGFPTHHACQVDAPTPLRLLAVQRQVLSAPLVDGKHLLDIPPFLF